MRPRYSALLNCDFHRERELILDKKGASCGLLTFRSRFKLQASTRVFEGPHITYHKSHEEVSHVEVELLW